MQSLQVLIVSPDTGRRAALADTFRQAGHRVMLAMDGREAAAVLESPGLDALVVDLAGAPMELSALRHALMPALTLSPESLEIIERRHIAATLRHTRGNKRRAAEILGIARSTLLAKVRRYGLEADGSAP